jgi:hypothetical protein
LGITSLLLTGPGTLLSAETTLLPVEIRPATVPPGAQMNVTYHWEAQPFGSPCKVFVHVRNAAGKMVLQDDHEPPYPIKTATWSGKVDYTRRIGLPSDLPEGTYEVFAGLYDKSGKKDLIAGPGVMGKDQVYQIGTLTVDAKAPPVPLDSAGKPTLDLTGYALTFSDEFDGPLDVSAGGPGTKWTAHTPYAGDFGSAGFANPGENSPFSIKDGILEITARKVNGKWRSGLLCSVDSKGTGFAQRYGYFEMRAQFPKGPGTWPAFWLNSLQSLQDKTKMGLEVDIVEQYGKSPGLAHGAVHWWWPDKTHDAIGERFTVADMTTGFHTYGFLWDEHDMRWFFDGVEVWRQPTPPEGNSPLYVLVNLALGGGWPIDRTPDPSVMLVDYIRVYAKK